MYLAEIKRDRPDVYKQDRAMMVDEYKSALDFYKDSRRAARFQPKEKTSRTPLLSPLTKRLTRTKKPKIKKAPTSKEEPKPAPSTPPLETELTKALQRIEKEQARQQRRFKK